MKVIFLDIDGVLNSSETAALYGGFDKFSPAAVGRLNWLTDRTEAKIVVSSAWRFGRSVLELKQILSDQGVTGEVIDKTPTKMSLRNRGQEIQHWMDNNSTLDEFVILDDDSDMGHLLDHLVQTDFNVGLTDVEMHECIRRLDD